MGLEWTQKLGPTAANLVYCLPNHSMSLRMLSYFVSVNCRQAKYEISMISSRMVHYHILNINAVLIVPFLQSIHARIALNRNFLEDALFFCC